MPEAQRRVLRRLPSILALISAFGLCPPAPASGQQPTPATASLAELRALIEEQRAALERQGELFAEQQRLLEQQAREIEDMRRRLDETSALALTSRHQLAELQQKPTDASVSAAVEERLAQVEDVHRLPELTQFVTSSIVSEFLWGRRRISKDGQRGEARQIQIGTNFRF